MSRARLCRNSFLFRSACRELGAKKVETIATQRCIVSRRNFCIFRTSSTTFDGRKSRHSDSQESLYFVIPIYDVKDQTENYKRKTISKPRGHSLLLFPVYVFFLLEGTEPIFLVPSSGSERIAFHRGNNFGRDEEI